MTCTAETKPVVVVPVLRIVPVAVGYAAVVRFVVSLTAPQLQNKVQSLNRYILYKSLS